jgi:predicted nucleotidyltransferase component of viral defense system
MVEVEANVAERRPKYELQWLPFACGFRGEAVSIALASFNIDEMLATKMRAMFQRKKGRDLFDLYGALTAYAAQPRLHPLYG